MSLQRLRRWGVQQEQLTLGEALALSVNSVGTPGRHEVTGDVLRLSRAVPDDNVWVAGVLAVAGFDKPVRFYGGALAGVRVGCVVTLRGYWETDHPEYGSQFRPERVVSVTVPHAREGLVRYLAGNVDGVGEVSARLLVEHFGQTVLDVLEAAPQRVREVLTGKRGEDAEAGVRKWCVDVEDDRWARHVAPQLMVAGEITYPTALRIARFFRTSEVADIIARRSPYRLMDVPGLGWMKTNLIARSMGVALDDPMRFEAAARWCARVATEDGHSALPRNELVSRVMKLAPPCTGQQAHTAIDVSIGDGELIEDGDLLYPPAHLWAEWDVAEMLAAAAAIYTPLTPAERRTVQALVREHKLTEEQQAAVYRALEHGVSVLTGRPGTGKTHTLRVVVAAARALGREVHVAAPTGKAASRATQVTGCKAQTIHKLLGGAVGSQREGGPLDRGMLVLDEASMIDAEMAAWLAKNVVVGAALHVVLCGDPQQLPSVGHGNFLQDVLTAGVLPTTRLTVIQRQAAQSRITQNAHALLDGAAMDLSPAADFRWIELPSGEDFDGAAAQQEVIRALRRVVQEERTSLLWRERHDRAFDPLRDLQVLTPRNDGPLGVTSLNEALRAVLNPGGGAGPRISMLDVRPGDRVIATRNEYSIGEAGLMNGDQGVVTAVTVTPGESVTARLDTGETITTHGPQNYLLSHAFAMTVHRSQGSEYPVALVCFHSNQYPVIDLPVLYTAVTRAKERVVLVADRKALAMVRTAQGAGPRRHTGLALHLRAATQAPTPTSEEAA